jgi:anion-transporting  ArsA/GET3 family ATPase
VQLRVPGAAPTKQLSRALPALVDTAPGVREIISMGKPLFEVWQETWDTVIVDAPPIGQLGSYLRAPQTIAGLVPAGPIRDQASRMQHTLRDQAGLVVVATPEELPVIEAAQAVGSIVAEDLVEVAAVVANRVVPELDVDDAVLAAITGTVTGGAARHHVATYRRQQRWLTDLEATVELPYLFGLLTPGEVSAQLADVMGP